MGLKETIIQALEAYQKKVKCNNCSYVQTVRAATIRQCLEIIKAHEIPVAKTKLNAMFKARNDAHDPTKQTEKQQIGAVLRMIAEAERRLKE